MNILSILQLQKLFHPTSNVEEVGERICNLLQIQHTEKWVSNNLRNHPNFPSMLSLKDLLNDLSVNAIAMRLHSLEALKDQHTPCIIQVKEQQSTLFATLEGKIDDDYIWYNPFTQRKEKISSSKLSSLFTGHVLLIEPTQEDLVEENFESHRKQELQEKVFAAVLILGTPFLSLFLLGRNLVIEGNLYDLLFCVSSFVGLVLSCLLFLYEAKAYVPLLNKVCNMSIKTNCNAVLSSARSSFSGVPWSIWGLSYFLCFICIGCVSCSNLQALSIVHSIAVLYIPFSIYYQYRIVQQWCPLCLGVQAVILSMFVISLLRGVLYTFDFPNISQLLIFAFTFAICFVLSYLLWRYVQERNTKIFFEQKFSQIKLDSNVFYARLQKERKLTTPALDLGIVIGNPRGRIHIIKICNPFCGPCAMVHPVLKKVVKSNPEVCVQIIFATDPDSPAYTNSPIPLFLHLAKETSKIEVALDYWYKTDNNDLDTFHQAFPSKYNAGDYYDQIKTMAEFCSKEQIYATPTIFVNGYELPPNYSVSDLRYCL